MRKDDNSAIQNAVLGAVGAKLLSLVIHRNRMRFLVNSFTGTTALQGNKVPFLQPEGKTLTVNFKISAPSYTTCIRLLQTQPQGYPNTTFSLPGPSSCLQEYAELIFCMRTDKLQSRIPSPHTPAQAPKKPHFAGKRRSRREVRAPEPQPERRCPATEHPPPSHLRGWRRGASTRSLGAEPRRGAPTGEPGRARTAERHRGAPPVRSAGRGAASCACGTAALPAAGYLPHPGPCPHKVLSPPFQTFSRSPPEPRGEARPRCPAPPPAPGTAGPERCRAGAAGAEPALAAVAPGQGGRGGAAGERRQPRLPLSSVSGWTAVSVAMSAAGLEPE